MSSPIRVAVLAASPMWFQSPLYRRLAAHPEIDFTAIFASTEGIRPHDPGYGQPIVWDVDALAGVRNLFLRRAGRNLIREGAPRLCDPDIVATLLRVKPDVLWLHGYSTLTHVLAWLTQRVRGGAVVVREEQTLLHGRPLWKTLVKRPLLGQLLQRSAGLYIGSRNRAWFEHFGMAPDRLFFCPYAVENESLQAEAAMLAPRRDELRRRLGVHPDTGPVILSVGRLVPKKQPLFLLEAFRRVRAELRCTLLVVGSGPLQAELERRVAADGIPDVVFAGFVNQSEIAKAYACGDIFVLPSLVHETWGMVVNEAMNFGLPIVASSNVGCVEDLVEHGANGFVVSPHDPGELAARLGRLVEDHELRSAFGRRSRARILDWNYDIAVRGALTAISAVTSDRSALREEVQTA
jgi:glycosyltransferase involved in cell wall biosynthesis